MPPPGRLNKPLTRDPYKHKSKKGKLKRLRSQSRPSLRRKLDAKRDEQRSESANDDGEVVTRHQNKILRTNPRANVKLSSKKKRKLMKARMFAEKELNEMAVEIEVQPKQKKSNSKSKKKPSADGDVEMMET